VTADDFALLPDPHTRLEPGLQAWAEIIGFGAALEWLGDFRGGAGETLAAHERRSVGGCAGLAALPRLQMIGARRP
jgi:cysteine desulfurase/selenocysteine lyase